MTQWIKLGPWVTSLFMSFKILMGPCEPVELFTVIRWQASSDRKLTAACYWAVDTPWQCRLISSSTHTLAELCPLLAVLLMTLLALLWCSQQARVQVTRAEAVQPFDKFNRFGLTAHSCTSCLISICHSRLCDLYSLFRRQQEVGHSPHSFHSLSNLPTLGPATARYSTQRPQAGSEAAAGGSHAGPWHWRPGAYSSRNHPPTDGPRVPTGGIAHLSYHRFATTNPNRFPDAGL